MNATPPLRDLGFLAGALRVAPGAPLPLALQSSRQDWAPRLARGQPASALPGLVASLFNLCSHAHRLCAQLAIEAAAPGLLPAPSEVAQRLRTETAQEHIRRIGLDWPRLLAAESGSAATARAGAAHAALQRCPLLRPTPTWPADPWGATLRWLQDDALQMPATTWLRAWQACGADWLHDWSRRHPGWLPALVHAARAFDTVAPLDPARALRAHAHAQADGQRQLSAALSLQPGFALHPVWHGACAHTGSWTRLNDPSADTRYTPWALLGGRIAELIRLCQPDAPGQSGANWLSFGSLSTGQQQGMAWVEMARGLLVHQVEIDGAASEARVAACHVLAPTEWNFHPQGEVAQRVAAMDASRPAEDTERRVRLLMAAFDPCVPFELRQPVPSGETPHA